jgi:hypothetical protein
MADLTTLGAEAAGAAALGFMGALARLAAAADPQPIFRRGFLFRALGEASLGLGGWLVAHAMGVEGLWAFVAAWACGVLGYGAIHDAMLRVLNQQTGGR